MKIHKLQIAKIEQSLDEVHAREIALYMREEHAEDVASLSDDELLRRVRIALARALTYDFTWDESITAFVAIMLTVAPTFDEQPAIRAVLRDERNPPNLRIDALWDRTSDDDWEEAAGYAATAESFWSNALHTQAR